MASSESLPPEFESVIIGSGIGGLGMAMRLRRAGYSSFLILEKASDLGGIWRDNTYPGCGCDVPSHLYSFSFELNRKWSRIYSRQPEILDYLHRCADKYDLRSNMRFNSTLTEASYDEHSHCWIIKTEDGFRTRARFLIVALGGLGRPKYPKIKGLERFQGKAFHTSRWDAAFDPTGKRIAIIGTGSSAVQVLPEIAPSARQIYLYQRSAPWILPRRDRPFKPFERLLLRWIPGAARLFRYLIYWEHEPFWRAFTRPQVMQKIQGLAQASLDFHISNVERRAALTPTYKLGCKRIVVSDNFLHAVSAANIDIVTDGITELTEDAILDDRGVRREVDAIIFGTGFRVSDPPHPLRILGRNGVDLNEAWKSGLHAYLGTMIPGYPNFFMLGGPNSGLGHNSAVFMLEAQFEYVMRSMRLVQDRKHSSMEIRDSVEKAFNEELQSRMNNTVWESGCRNWYQDENGRNVAMWPGHSFSFWARTRKIVEADYIFGDSTVQR